MPHLSAGATRAHADTLWTQVLLSLHHQSPGVSVYVTVCVCVSLMPCGNCLIDHVSVQNYSTVDLISIHCRTKCVPGL